MNDTIDFQMVTENVASTLEPSLRVVEYISPSWNFIIVFMAMLFMVLNKQLYNMRFRMMLSVLTQSSDSERMMREWNPIVSFNGFTVFGPMSCNCPMFRRSVLPSNANPDRPCRVRFRQSGSPPRPSR